MSSQEQIKSNIAREVAYLLLRHPTMTREVAERVASELLESKRRHEEHRAEVAKSVPPGEKPEDYDSCEWCERVCRNANTLDEEGAWLCAECDKKAEEEREGK